MGLSFRWIGGFNPFDFVACPTCGGTEYTSTSGSVVGCNRCNTIFTVRATAGDPGCVVDATNENAWGPIHTCPACKAEVPSYDDRVVCTSCNKRMVKHELGYETAFPWGKVKRWYQILKIGDDASGWIRSGNLPECDERYSHPSCHDEDLQRRWVEFQQQPDFKVASGAKPGGARFQIVSKEGI